MTRTNRDREERISMIIAMMMTIANISEEKATKLLKSTNTYQNIVDGNECTLHESYSANLEDVVEELRERGKCAFGKNITEEAVTNLNKCMLDEGIKNAKQFKEAANVRQTIVNVIPDEQTSDRATIPSQNLPAGIRRIRRSIRRTIKVKA